MSDHLGVPARIALPWGAWSGGRVAGLAIPCGWQATMLRMADAPGLDDDDMSSALRKPVGAPAYEDILRGGSTLAIAIDDATRPTRTAPIVAWLVRYAVTAGIAPERITVLVANGAHRRLERSDLSQKIGPSLPSGVRVLSHDPVRGVVESGVTLAGVPIRLHQEFLAADVRVGVGAVVPHPFAGFSGGGKIVVPGLADLDVLARTHKFALMGFRGGAGLDGNRFRSEMEAAVRAIGLHWTVNVVLNSRCETAGLVAGDMVQAHRAASAIAARVGATPPPDQLLDALVLNAYPKDTEVLQVEAAFVALKSGMLAWLRRGAPVVLVGACPDGLGHHKLFGPGGRLYRAPSRRPFLGDTPLWLWLPGVSENDVRTVFPAEYPLLSNWAAVVERLGNTAGLHATIGVVPCGPLQLAREGEPPTDRGTQP